MPGECNHRRLIWSAYYNFVLGYDNLDFIWMAEKVKEQNKFEGKIEQAACLGQEGKKGHRVSGIHSALSIQLLVQQLHPYPRYAGI
jgi:hypothetical protein